MSFDTTLKIYETLTLFSDQAFSGAKTKDISVTSGSRMLVQLLVTAIDPATTVTLTANNGFDPSNLEAIEQLSLSAVGRQKKILSDFHKLFNFAINVTGGNATFKVGVSIYDNALETRVDIANADISVDISAQPGPDGKYSSVRIADAAGHELAVNPDGSLNIASGLSITGFATEAKQDAEIAAINAMESALNADLAQLDADLATLHADNLVVEGKLDTLHADNNTIVSKLNTIHADLGIVEGKQDIANASLASIDGKLADTANGLKVDGSGVVQPVSGSISVSNFPATQPISAAALPLPAGAATSANQTTANSSLSSIDGKLATTVNGLKVDVQASALPSGAATSANQATANASLASIDSKLTSPLSVTGPLTDTQLRASAVPVSAASLPLPAGAATSANQATEIAALGTLHTDNGVIEGKLDTLHADLGIVEGKQDTGNASLASIDTKTPALGQTTKSASQPVTIASDQTPMTANRVDVSGTFAASGNTAAIDTQGFGSIAYTVNVTAATGTLDLELQTSDDGVNWNIIYDSPRFSATGTDSISAIRLSKRYYRFAYTIAGGSFTFSVTSTLKPNFPPRKASLIRYTDLNLANSNNTSTVFSADASNVSLIATRSGGSASVAAFNVQVSNDQVSWATLTTTPVSIGQSATVSVDFSGKSYKYYRAITSTTVAGAKADMQWSSQGE